MAIIWNDNQRRVAEVILKHRDESPSGYDLKGIRTELSEKEAVDSYISTIVKELKALDWKIPPKEKAPASPSTEEEKPPISDTSHADGTVRSDGEKPGADGSSGMELSEKGLTLSITLPPVVLTLFDAAKGAGLEDAEKDLDSWLFECVQKRFQLDYCLQLRLVPVGDGYEVNQKMKELAKQAAKEAVAEAKAQEGGKR